MSGLKVKNPRIPRKPGQPANSDKHSDLFTDENPKGTIHGLKFVNAREAAKSVAKIKGSGKTHAHKTQAAIAMEQRARTMGKTDAANVYRQFIEEQKKKTKEKNASAILIKPPPSEADRAKELAQVQKQYKNRYNPESLQKRLDLDMPGLYSDILKKKGIDVPASQIRKLEKSIVPIVRRHKKHFNIERPNVLAKKLGIPFKIDYLKSAQTPSYPSGHTAQAHYIYLVLSSKFPEARKELLEVAKMVENSRIDRGVHFLSDNKAGAK